MSFFSDFASLGYSGITLAITFLFATGLVFVTFGLGKRPVWLRLAAVLVMAGLFVATTQYLATERRVMMDALKAQGGPKPVPRN